MPLHVVCPNILFTSPATIPYYSVASFMKISHIFVVTVSESFFLQNSQLHRYTMFLFWLWLKIYYPYWLEVFSKWAKLICPGNGGKGRRRSHRPSLTKVTNLFLFDNCFKEVFVSLVLSALKCSLKWNVDRFQKTGLGPTSKKIP